MYCPGNVTALGSYISQLQNVNCPDHLSLASSQPIPDFISQPWLSFPHGCEIVYAFVLMVGSHISGSCK